MLEEQMKDVWWITDWDSSLRIIDELRGAVNKFPDWIFRARTKRSNHTSR